MVGCGGGGKVCGRADQLVVISSADTSGRLRNRITGLDALYKRARATNAALHHCRV